MTDTITTHPESHPESHPATGPTPVIPLARPTLGDAEIQAVAEVLRSGWVTQGSAVERFEADVAGYVGAAAAVAVANCTAALHLTLHCLGVGPGHEVIVPTLTFIATANAVRHCGATPVFADVYPRTLNIDPTSAAAAISDRTRAIVAVHQFGMPADLEGLHAVASRNDCSLIEDAACAIGSEYHGRRIGSHGSPACFSFHPRKIVTTGEGGMIVTDDLALADRLRRLRSHGRDLGDWLRHRQGLPQRESYGEIGYNYRLSDIAAAVGVAQMEQLDAILAARRRLGDRYDAVLSGHPYLSAPHGEDDVRPNRQSYAVTLGPEAPIDRTALIAAMRERGVAAMPGLACIHLEPCYARTPPRVDLSCSEELSRRMVLLPLYAHMTDAQQRHVIRSLFDVFGLPAP